MRGFSSFFTRASRTLHDSPTISKLLVVFTLSGGGLISYAESQSEHGASAVEPYEVDVKKKRVLVLGTGWAGISFLKDLDISSYDVQVVSPRNYFAFTPLLPSVTCGTVEARSIIEPVRNIIKKVCTDNASNFKLAGKWLEEDTKILWNGCSAHVVNLMVGDVCAMFDDVVKEAKKVSVFIYNHPNVLHLMREETKGGDLIRPSITRFATSYLSMESMYEKRQNLRDMIHSPKWRASKYPKEKNGKEVAKIIKSNKFWEDMHLALKVMAPIVDVIRMVDTEDKPSMPYLYSAIDICKEKIKNNLGEKNKEDRDLWNKVERKIDTRWHDMLHRPLHCAAHYLNPSVFYATSTSPYELESNTMVKEGLLNCITKLAKDEDDERQILQDLVAFRTKRGRFGKNNAQMCIKTYHPVEWWISFGSEVPALQRFAKRVLGLTCSASPCERNWSLFNNKSGQIQFLEAECIKIDAANKRVVCRSNDDLFPEKGEFFLDYDYLVIAIGAQVNTFNTPGVAEHCHFLKDVEDAQRIRRSVMYCFEKASLPNLSEEERRTHLHFVIVGGGPTGVEFAATLHDFVIEDLVKLYPDVQDLMRITVIQAGDHILNTYDERISLFAEQKFQRDGIEVKMECRVVGVTDKAIHMKEKSKGETFTIPYGMVVWSTGNGTRPVVKDYMEQIGQTKRRTLGTDEWLRVEGCDNVYALGDCSSMNQRKVMEDISTIFTAADKDNSGTLTVKEFQDVIGDILVRYPQVDVYLRRKRLRGMIDLLNDAEGHGRQEVDIEGFKQALEHVDSQMKCLPATAQVAAQQGAYLAKCFNHMEQSKHNPEGPLLFGKAGHHQFRPFLYKHFGQFAPLGGEQTAAELPGDWVSMGHSSQWLWYSVYASKQVSWRTRVLVVSDWIRRFIFGRDSSGI